MNGDKARFDSMNYSNVDIFLLIYL